MQSSSRRRLHFAALSRCVLPTPLGDGPLDAPHLQFVVDGPLACQLVGTGPQDGPVVLVGDAPRQPCTEIRCFLDVVQADLVHGIVCGVVKAGCAESRHT